MKKIFCENMERFTSRKVIAMVILLVLLLSVLTTLTPIAPSLVAEPSPERIYGQNSVPIVGAIVMASGPEGSGFATTDSSGLYTISEGLKSGTYTVSVVALGYLVAEEGGVSVAVGEETSNVDFYLYLSGGISGKVSDATSGAAVAGIMVMAVSSDGEYSWWAMTDSNGNYLIATNLATGTYNVTVFLPEDYITKTISGVEVTAGAETTGVDLALDPSGVISGTVTATDGTPLVNATVMAMSEDEKYYGFATSDVGGNYSISSGLGTGTYMVFAMYDMGFAQVSDVGVIAGEETSGVDLVIDVPPPTPSGGISGKVTDTEGNPIEGASVTASGPAGYGSTETDENGNYLISEGLGTGAYTVEASAAGFVSGNITGVEVEVGGETKNVNFQLERIPPEESGIISGTVSGEVREDVEPNDSFDQAESTTAGTHTGSLDHDTDPNDYYKVEVYGGQTISVTATPASTLAIDLYLYNQDRSEVSWGWGGEGQVMEASWTTNSEEPNYTYYIRLSAGSYGTYTLDVTLTFQNDAESGGDAGDSFEAATQIASANATYSGFLKDYDENDFYKLNITAGQTISIDVTPDTSLAVDLSLYNPDRAEVAYVMGAVGESVHAERTTNSEQPNYTYYIRVAWGGGDGGNYELEVIIISQNDAATGGDAGDDLDTSTPIDVGTHSGFLKGDDTDDCYRVVQNVTAGQGIYVKVTPAPTLAVNLYLYDQERAQKDAYWGEEGEIVRVSARAEETGNFYIKVKAGSHGTYTMMVSIEPSLGIPTREPEIPDAMENVTVSVNATAVQNGIDSVVLSYSTNEGVSWTDVAMTYNATTKLYEGMIPGFEAGTKAHYKITAYDEAGDYFVQDKAGEYHIYTVIPEFPTVILLPLFIIATLVATIMMKKRKT